MKLSAASRALLRELERYGDKRAAAVKLAARLERALEKKTEQIEAQKDALDEKLAEFESDCDEKNEAAAAEVNECSDEIASTHWPRVARMRDDTEDTGAAKRVAEIVAEVNKLFSVGDGDQRARLAAARKALGELEARGHRTGARKRKALGRGAR